MPEAIVDRLEIVEIERQHREWRTAARGPANFGFDPLHEPTAIISTCQWIGRRQVPEFLIGALEFLQGALGIRHRLGKTHHQLLLAVNLRERPRGEECLHDPIAQQEESSGEDHMSEPPHVVPRTGKNKGERGQCERGDRDDNNHHQRRTDTAQQEHCHGQCGKNEGTTFQREAHREMAGDRRIRDVRHCQVNQQEQSYPGQPRADLHSLVRGIRWAVVRKHSD
ncbi:hypothetical protein PS723_06180 [Pseudomonas fluorescens]|uniref:Uncharacterized protein n=1 Tax=Pseudomonas fluorescens TaxID=294 RepID=A0A5E7FY76_PSEFL|nr:hypothetical protein PS723_06180 [Pseudomonas fluorescens]